MKTNALILALLCLATAALAHDTWLQTNTNIVRVGDVVYIDLLLGNHGNEHRDFKIAGKAPMEKSTIEMTSPDGKTTDIKPSFTDSGLGAKEGAWIARYQPAAAGLYVVSQTSDAVVSYAPKRSVKSAKTFFLASKSLDKVGVLNPGYDKVFGHALELVPQANPVTPMGPGTPLAVKLLFKGQPVANATVSFIPRGEALKEGFDDRHERKTDDKGVASFEPRDGNYYLIVAHHKTDEKGEGYEETSYSATIGLYVPALCPCCGD